ncbi:MAG: ribonuclease HII [Anaerolineae bacterium]|nr:MAG: ribonuclease HII [Anaerolineae bacterium]
MPRRTPLELPPTPHLKLESAHWQQGVRYVAGLDEAGRGALAGPVAVGAVILPPTQEIATRLEGVRDSKQMTPKAREQWAERIRTHALAWAVGMASPQEIDDLGIVPAIRLAAQRALQQLSPSPQALLTDYGLRPESSLPLQMLVKGDRRSLSIAAASILAKTQRDALMRCLDAQYPGYGLAQHKGYATRAHRFAIGQLGLSAIHRHTFTVKTFPKNAQASQELQG